MICGIDLGSRQVKIVLMHSGQLQKMISYETIEFYRQYGRQESNQLVLCFANLPLGTWDKVVATGYGRNTVHVKGADNIPEIRAHVLGAIWQTKLSDFTLLDLGGQDAKVVQVRQGKIQDFLTNDRCAASTGRYLENMANVLAISPTELGQYSDNPVDLNATCAIFGESELIGKVLEGHPLSRLAAGVNYTIFKRIRPMLNQLHSEVIIFTGGVALNTALQAIIARELNVKVLVPPFPQYNGAIGCCVYGGGDLCG
ncbi:MAG: 2-hydroxyglutaryl-CoA dehydratase [Firmicutes bacterium]|nr:2-hydroxyglutaryl-CoA dehydratase [Bacillota bacterium]